MIKLYHDEDLYEAVRQKRRLLDIFLAVTAVYIAGLVTLSALYIGLTYNDPSATWYIVGASVLTAVYIIFSFPYMGISYKRSRAYCKMLKYISLGLKECTVAPFVGIEDWITHDGVDVNVATFSVPNPKRDEPMLRQIYVDGEKEFPAFREGHKAKMILQGNLLIGYELEEIE